jgi:hypothetical protein
MSVPKFNPRGLVLFAFILAIALLRVILNFSDTVSALANFSPVGAMALFGGAYFSNRWKGILFPVLTLFVSDFILHQTVFRQYGNGFLYSGWYLVYGAFALMAIAGHLIMKHVTVNRFVISTLVCVFIHWIITDLGVWYRSSLYTQNFTGYLHCLVVAIPFELKFLASTVIYGAIMFGAFEWLQNRYTSLKPLRA